jgi:hypothetical protein
VSAHTEAAYVKRLEGLRQGPPVLCAHCQRAAATTLDHYPPLAMHKHVSGSHCCRLLPSCEPCNMAGGIAVREGRWRPNVALADVEREPERDGLEADDARWRTPWLVPLLEQMPESAVWPRLMTVPHPAATGSLGAEFADWADWRSGYELRWWQQLVAGRLLEHDADGRLVWETMVLTLARQVGKSWLLRELCLWRMHQSKRFGEPQDVMHTGKDLAICKEVQRPARVWAKRNKHDYKVREVNGQEEIELLEDGSRWMVRAKDAVYGYSAAAAAVDEGWKVPAASVDEGLTPTMAEREQAQLWLVSTAHRRATKLMLERRTVALLELETGAGDLLIEWSPREGAAVADVDAWRQASPHWTARRHSLISRRLKALEAGEGTEDEDEPDPEQSFRAQWMNQWPRKHTPLGGATEPLLPAGIWHGLAAAGLESDGPVWVALEDDAGYGSAVAAACRLDDGRIEVDGWLRGDWDSAVADLEQLVALRDVRGILVGPALLDRLPPVLAGRAEKCAAAQTKTGLALLRDLALTKTVCHDVSTADLDATVDVALVREAPSGLQLVAKGPTHLVRALVWSLGAAHKPAPMPAIH